jgi:hypothetical protein
MSVCCIINSMCDVLLSVNLDSLTKERTEILGVYGQGKGRWGLI